MQELISKFLHKDFFDYLSIYLTESNFKLNKDFIFVFILLLAISFLPVTFSFHLSVSSKTLLKHPHFSVLAEL